MRCSVHNSWLCTLYCIMKKGIVYMNKIMILKGGSSAIHKLGDIGRTKDSFIRVGRETDKYFIGNFEEGFGFINVKFCKSDCRPINEEEFNYLNRMTYTINNTPLYKIQVDKEGNVLPSQK